MSGRLIAFVGPSGVGKDSVMTALAEMDPSFTLVRRVITRAPEAGGEEYTPVTEVEFEAMRDAGAFCLSWQAHGLHYGIPQELCREIAGGAEKLINLSRSMLTEAARVFPGLVILNISASPDVLAARLAGRGRESAEEIARRLERAEQKLPEGLSLHHIRNDGPLPQTLARVLAVLQPVRA